MARYHVGKNGPAPCRATKGKCPLGGESGTDNHYDSMEEAQGAFEKQLAEEHKPMEGTESPESFLEEKYLFAYTVTQAAVTDEDDYYDYESFERLQSGEDTDWRSMIPEDRETLTKNAFGFGMNYRANRDDEGLTEALYIEAEEEYGDAEPKTDLERELFDEYGDLKGEYSERLMEDKPYAEGCSLGQVRAAENLLNGSKSGRAALAAIDAKYDTKNLSDPVTLAKRNDEVWDTASNYMVNRPNEMYAQMAMLKLDEMGDPSPQEDKEFMSMVTVGDPDNWRNVVGNTPEEVETNRDMSSLSPVLAGMYEREISSKPVEDIRSETDEWESYYSSIGSRLPAFASEELDPNGVPYVTRRVNARQELLKSAEGRAVLREGLDRYGMVTSEGRKKFIEFVSNNAVGTLVRAHEAKWNRLCDERLAELRGA